MRGPADIRCPLCRAFRFDSATERPYCRCRERAKRMSSGGF
ncbi:hypothetical protein FTUN_6518 [Frigoriglobus tundricola]|uniref:Uncharacterized protein n=1 Tax=Frigoriglobus tundricola TaxID=2774151 RepID=A0A6M5Z0D7_9BACT|nr:hypothetical protein FTUN_6518 [Frigoriglobus tundricola]